MPPAVDSRLNTAHSTPSESGGRACASARSRSHQRPGSTSCRRGWSARRSSPITISDQQAHEVASPTAAPACGPASATPRGGRPRRRGRRARARRVGSAHDRRVAASPSATSARPRPEARRAAQQAAAGGCAERIECASPRALSANVRVPTSRRRWPIRSSPMSTSPSSRSARVGSPRAWRMATAISVIARSTRPARTARRGRRGGRSGSSGVAGRRPRRRRGRSVELERAGDLLARLGQQRVAQPDTPRRHRRGRPPRARPGRCGRAPRRRARRGQDRT